MLILSLLWSFAFAISPSELKTGDLILLPLDCDLCELIRGEEKSDYSHIGVYLEPNQVLEAWGSVKSTSLSSFVNRKKIAVPVLVKRPNFNVPTQRAKNIFEKIYSGLDYDSYFKWSRRPTTINRANKALYCTEFAYFFLLHFGHNVPRPKAMHFEYNRDAWINYFSKLNPAGSPPDDEPGLSPGDFERFNGFENLGALDEVQNRP